MKNLYFILLLLINIAHLKSQDLYYKIKIYSETPYDTIHKKRDTTSIRSYHTKNKVKTETPSLTMLAEENKFTIVNYDLGICCVFTKEQLKHDSLENGREYLNLRVTKSDETKCCWATHVKRQLLHIRPMLFSKVGRGPSI